MDDARRVGVARSATRWLPWLAGAVLVAGVAVSLITLLGGRNSAKPLPPPAPRAPTQRSAQQKSAPLEPEARRVAGRFILTAVARRNLAEAYDLVGPQLKQGLTRAQWKTGNIPVVPYPVSSLDDIPTLKVDISYKSYALLEVVLFPGRTAKSEDAKVKPQLFALELRAYGKGKARHWLVTGWVPTGAPAIPQSGG